MLEEEQRGLIKMWKAKAEEMRKKNPASYAAKKEQLRRSSLNSSSTTSSPYAVSAAEGENSEEKKSDETRSSPASGAVASGSTQPGTDALKTLIASLRTAADRAEAILKAMEK